MHALVDHFEECHVVVLDPQAPQPRAGGGRTATKSGKQKLAVFSDSDNPESNQPPVSSLSKGWDSIGSIRDRRKENEMEAKPWAGETLKQEKKPVPVQKMAVFRDEVSAERFSFPLDSIYLRS